MISELPEVIKLLKGTLWTRMGLHLCVRVCVCACVCVCVCVCVWVVREREGGGGMRENVVIGKCN